MQVIRCFLSISITISSPVTGFSDYSSSGILDELNVSETGSDFETLCQETQ
jgi:hypothetical protein